MPSRKSPGNHTPSHDAAVWHLPADPEAWPATQRLLDRLDGYGIERLSTPLDG